MVALQRSGEIATRPLPGLLLDLHEEDATGSLALRRAGVLKTVELWRGQPVRVTSTLREETLGHFLVRNGVIGEAQHRDAVQRAAQDSLRLGETLVAMGVLRPEQLLEQLYYQDRHKLVAALRWPQGAWRFEAAAIQPTGVQLPMVELVLVGLRDSGATELDRLRRFDGASCEMNGRGRQLVPALRRCFGDAVSDALTRGGAIAAIERACADRFLARNALDALELCGGMTAQRLPASAGTTNAQRATVHTRVVVYTPPAAAPAMPAPPPPTPPRPAAPPTATAITRRLKPLLDEPADERPHPAGELPSDTLPELELDLGLGPGHSVDISLELGAPDHERDLDDAGAVERTTTRRHATPWPHSPASPLYELLFDEPAAPGEDGATPLTALDASSGAVSSGELDAANEHGEAAMRMRRALVAEAQRIRTADLYTILMVDRGASEAELAAAISARQRAFSREHYSRFALGFDRPRLEEVLAAYAGARDVLLDDDRRRAYDRALAGAETAAAHTLDAEVAFREAEDLLARQRFAEAIALLESLVARAPAQADFHAALGWAHWLYKGPSASAAHAARPHLNRALEIDPEHVSAHVRRGIVGVLLGEDAAEVIFHLERALELQPARADALEHLEPILIRRGELRRLERLYKRLLFRLSSNFAGRAAEIWLGLAQLYAHHLDEHEAAAIALGNAETLAPAHPHVAEVAVAVRAATIAPRHPLEAARAQLRRTREPGAAAALIRSAGETGQHDAAFLTAATMVALGTADVKMVQTYDRLRPRGPRLPEVPLTAEHWAKLRHPDDVADLGLLLDIVAPAVHRLAPIELADAGIEPSMRVAEHELPAAFGRVRRHLAHLLGVAPPPVYARPELERHIQLVACDPPALIAGDDALTAPERADLVCRLARAMSNAHPGRAAGGSRSGTVLRAIVLAVIREASFSTIGEREPGADRADAALDVLSIGARGDARAAALRLLARGNGLNLSVWSASLPRTADRAGLLLCSDIPTALAVARESGHLERDLVEFAFSAEHAALRAELEISVDG